MKLIVRGSKRSLRVVPTAHQVYSARICFVRNLRHSNALVSRSAMGNTSNWKCFLGNQLDARVYFGR